MTLKVTLLESGLYEAKASPPHVKDAWSSPEPLQAKILVEQLLSRGCHQQDVGDAFAEQDPDWLTKL
jgi:hypothetical protein